MGNGSSADTGDLPNAKADTRQICDAMALQHRHDSPADNESVPQQFVHLVGCRDPNAHRTPRIRPPAPNS